MTLIEALEHSRNVVTIRLYEAIGLDRGLELVRRFDVTGARAQWRIPREISTPLGTIDVSPLEMAAAYQMIANQGIGMPPRLLRNAIDKEGRIPFRHTHSEKALLDPIAAYQTLYLLRQVVLGGTGRTEIGSRFPSPPNPPVCGKTGTTNDCRDAWFCGFSPDLVLVVQVGFDRPRPLGPRMTGGRVAGPIWADAFEGILATRSHWSMAFDPPPGVRYANVCAETGKRAGEVCRSLGHHVYLNVPFRADRPPAAFCDGHPRVPIIKPVGDQYAWEAQQAPIAGIAQRPDKLSLDEISGGAYWLSDFPDTPEAH
jgi:penicillin-binding protein 1A